MSGATQFEVRRGAIGETRFTSAPSEPGAGEAELRIDMAALTANTVTYAVHGQSLRYWDFYPAADGWGRVPAWGFATAVRSRVPGLAEGERIYGFLAFADRLRLRLEPSGATGLTETSAHRTALPGAYNRYRRWPGVADPIVPVLQPLHATAYLFDDFLAANGYFGAEQLVVSSASSKTALGIAHALGLRVGRPRLIALTSPGNSAFTAATGAYDEVLPYAELETIPARPTAYIDLAGDRALRARVHARFGEHLTHSAAIGDTHMAEIGPKLAAPTGPRPQFFFAPAWLKQRQADWGDGGAAARLDTAWAGFVDWIRPHLTVRHEHGPDALTALWTQAVTGRVAPRDALLLSL
jgi:hypothetical protein